MTADTPSYKLLLAGKKRSGKTTVANYLKIRYPGTVELTFADPLKLACQAIFLLSDEQLVDEKKKEEVDPRWGVSPRTLFQRVGDLFRDYLPMLIPGLVLDKGLVFTQNMYYRLKALEESSSPPEIIVISDGRMEDEHSFVKSLPNSGSIMLQRDTESDDRHKSEQIPFTCDSTLVNNSSLPELFTRLDETIQSMEIDTSTRHEHSDDLVFILDFSCYEGIRNLKGFRYINSCIKCYDCYKPGQILTFTSEYALAALKVRIKSISPQVSTGELLDIVFHCCVSAGDTGYHEYVVNPPPEGSWKYVSSACIMELEVVSGV